MSHVRLIRSWLASSAVEEFEITEPVSDLQQLDSSGNGLQTVFDGIFYYIVVPTSLIVNLFVIACVMFCLFSLKRLGMLHVLRLPCRSLVNNGCRVDDREGTPVRSKVSTDTTQCANPLVDPQPGPSNEIQESIAYELKEVRFDA